MKHKPILSIRLTAAQREVLNKAVKVDIKSNNVSEFVRNASLYKAKKVLKESKS